MRKVSFEQSRSGEAGEGEEKNTPSDHERFKPEERWRRKTNEKLENLYKEPKTTKVARNQFSS